MSISASKNSLVHELFVRTADENYITARWCAINRLNTDFLWLAVHALEKYLKAVLLVNGRSSRGYSHNIVKLYEAVKSFAGPLLSDRLTQPANLDILFWSERSADQFLQHLLRNGNADNRYLIYGYVTLSQDLHMLDQMVFTVRRLICSLDERVFPHRNAGAPNVTNREVLTNQPEYYRRLSMPLDNFIAAKEESPARAAALNLNMAFAPKDFQHTAIWGGSASCNPVIIRSVLDPLKCDDARRAADGVEIANWLLKSVLVPKEVKAEIENAV